MRDFGGVRQAFDGASRHVVEGQLFYELRVMNCLPLRISFRRDQDALQVSGWPSPLVATPRSNSRLGCSYRFMVPLDYSHVPERATD